MTIDFYRVRQLKFHGEREEELDDILLMVSAFGLFSYAVFSTVAGSLSAYSKEPNLLVMVTGILSVLQVNSLPHYTAKHLISIQKCTIVGFIICNLLWAKFMYFFHIGKVTL